MSAKSKIEAEQIEDDTDDTDSFGSSSDSSESWMKDQLSFPTKHRSIYHPFADLELLKQMVRESLYQPVYDVRNYYKKTGCAQTIARSDTFGSITLFVIALNSIWLGYDTDYNQAPNLIQAKPQFQVMENLFCTFFTLEISFRFLAFESKLNCLKDGWFVFDSILVILMIIDTWIMTAVLFFSDGKLGAAQSGGQASIGRLLRLLRLSRVARMLRSMPELMILVKGITSALRSVLLTLALLLIIMYVFAIVLTQLSAGSPSGNTYFFSILSSMYYLTVCGLFFDELTTFVTPVGDDSWMYATCFWLFVLFGTLTVTNMLIGVLLEVVAGVAAVEREEMIVTYMRTKVTSIIEAVSGEDGYVHLDVFRKLMSNRDCIQALREVGVDPVGLVDFAEFLFQDPNSEQTELSAKIPTPKFLDLLLQLRGSNIATVRDVVDLRKYLSSGLDKSQQNLKKDIVKQCSSSEFWDDATFIQALRLRPVKVQAVFPSRLQSLVEDLERTLSLVLVEYEHISSSFWAGEGPTSSSSPRHFRSHMKKLKEFQSTFPSKLRSIRHLIPATTGQFHSQIGSKASTPPLMLEVRLLLSRLDLFLQRKLEPAVQFFLDACMCHVQSKKSNKPRVSLNTIFDALETLNSPEPQQIRPCTAPPRRTAPSMTAVNSTSTITTDARARAHFTVAVRPRPKSAMQVRSNSTVLPRSTTDSMPLESKRDHSREPHRPSREQSPEISAATVRSFTIEADLKEFLRVIRLIQKRLCVND